MSHFLASLWVYIGRYGEESNTGWIVRLKNNNLIGSSYPSMYIAALYYVFTTLSTVGYGDIVGVDILEYSF
jgi:hypothetical protein